MIWGTKKELNPNNNYIEVYAKRFAMKFMMLPFHYICTSEDQVMCHHLCTF